MTNGQRTILGMCTLLLAGYLAWLGLGSTVSQIPAAPDSALAADKPPAVTDAMTALASIGISLEPYRHGVVKAEGATVRVERNGEDGFGVFFMPGDITSNRVIRFGAEGNERVIFRSTVAGERFYRTGAQGDFMRITPDTDEVLIFTDDADYINITLDRITDCGSKWDTFCADENYLANKIGVPVDAPPSKEDLLQILDWTANNLVWSGDRSVTLEANALVKQYSAAQMYATVYEPEAGGGFCGASGVFLSKVLNDLGYQALTINFGTGPDLTHVSTLVYSPFGDGKFYMVDPTFNSIFVDKVSGEWIAFDDLLAGNTQTASILERPVEGRKFLVREASAGLVDCRPAKGRMGAQICSRPGYSFDVYMSSFKNAFVEAGLSPDTSGYMHMLRTTYFNIGNQAGSDVRDRFIALLDQNGIAIAK